MIKEIILKFSYVLVGCLGGIYFASNFISQHNGFKLEPNLIKIVVILSLSIYIFSVYQKSKFNLINIFSIVTIVILINFILTIIEPAYSLVYWDNQVKVTSNSDNDLWSVRGQIGDLLAGHFTALAFIGLLFSILQMQKSIKKQDKAIKIQKKEMKLQRRELKKTAKSLDLQVRLTEKQNFENTFFKMHDLYSKTVNDMSLEYNKSNYQGNDTFNTAVKILYDKITKKLKENNNKFLTEDEMMSIYIDFLNVNHTVFSHYFRVTYRIIKYVDSYQDIYGQIDKKFYIKLLRANFTSFETLILFFNGLTYKGTKFKPLIEEYSLFEHFAAIKMLSTIHSNLCKKYKIKAFGDGPLSKKNNINKYFYSTEKN